MDSSDCCSQRDRKHNNKPRRSGAAMLSLSAPQLTSPSLTGHAVQTNIANRFTAKLSKELAIQRRNSQGKAIRRSVHLTSKGSRSLIPSVGSHSAVPSSPGDTSHNSFGPGLQWPMSAYNGLLRAPHRSTAELRRWSIVSLPSSGYETTSGGSALSSEYSSSEHLYDSFGVGFPGFNCSQTLENSSASLDFDIYGNCSPVTRRRARSLTKSPLKRQTDDSETTLRNGLYKERFPKAKQDMESKLKDFIEVESKNENSDVLLSDAIARFIHHQIVELAQDCLHKSWQNTITSSYFYELSQELDDLIVEAEEKSSCTVEILEDVVRQLMLIIARPARLLECLEFDPSVFYALLEEAEDSIRGDVSEPIPQYIIKQLGLDKNSPPPVELAEANHEQLSEKVSSGDADDVYSSLLSKAPAQEDFEKIKLISNGAYGAVYLVRHKETKHRFALKAISKTNLILRNQVEQVFAERDILTFTDNPFVVSFYGSFETNRHLCLVLEYVEGGDCASLLKNIGVLSIDMARLYIAETILAVEYLHSYGIIHRDLKPDNLLITAVGHIKLTDFGLSKIGLMNRTNLACENWVDKEHSQFQDKQVFGTPEYIAPEVFLRRGYGKAVDWWSVGIILYEMLVGVPPFYGDTPEELFSQVLSNEIEWPEEPYTPPFESQALILSLLQQNPFHRLGTRSGAVELKSHPFFHCINWVSLIRQKAEFVPQLDDEEDTSYFDPRTDRYQHDQDSDPEDSSSWASTSATSSPAPNIFSSFPTSSPRYSFIADMATTARRRESCDIGSIAAQHSSEDSSGSFPSSATVQHLRPRLSTSWLAEHWHLLSTRSAERDSLKSSDSGGVEDLPHVEKGASTKTSRKLPYFGNSKAKNATQDPKSHEVQGDKLVMDTGEVVQLRRRASDKCSSPLPKFSFSYESGDSAHEDSGKNSFSEPMTSTSKSDGSRSSEAESLVPPPKPPVSSFLSPLIESSTGLLSNETEESEMTKQPTRIGTSTSNVELESLFKAEELCVDSTPKRHLSMQRHNKHSLRISLGPAGPGSSVDVSARPGFSSGGKSRGETSPILLQGHPSSCPGGKRSTSSQGLHLVIPGESTPHRSPGGSSASSRDTSPARSNGNGNGVKLRSSSKRGQHQGSGGFCPLSQQLKPPIVIRKGPGGYGFAIRAIRVYIGDTDYYTLQHVVTSVDEAGPAFEAGLRPNDLITHVNGESVSNENHTAVLQRMHTCKDKILQLRVTPMEQTSIKNGPPRRNVGKLAKRKAPRRKVRQSGRRDSKSLLRRMSGKRAAAAVGVCGSGAELKALPRSISTSESLLAIANSPEMVSPPPSLVMQSNVIMGNPSSSSRPSTLQGLTYGITHKIANTFKSPRLRKQSNTIPLSPLARSHSPARSPSPLASTISRASSGKKTITKPRKSDAGISSTNLHSPSDSGNNLAGASDNK